MTVRELIEMLSKTNWNSKIFIDTRKYKNNNTDHEIEKIKGIDEILSISQYSTTTTLNLRTI